MDATGAGYTTIAARVETELEIERSRFICVLERVEHEDAARAVIAGVRAAEPRARHHCTAFLIGPRGELARSSDDGEPSGTAGLPMLEALRGEGLSDVVAVVTRYFGGVLLGTGGLVRAYTASVQESARAATRVRRGLRTLVSLTADYDRGPSLDAELRRLGHPPLDVVYGEDMRIDVGVPPEDLDAFAARVAELTAGAAGIRIGGTAYVDEAR
ncbi:YigZ family protein [Agromyces seonyuensis]|uniref:YigZ family protein n=1 Tax=Agromyces seonyuensis TaxID=2662446 RepID=A0A6I4NXZ8_9MICO|nr:YigZ family protein [Agromyces seonyuensis]MWB99186.1 YigZ family protein [Agromyces seonyuensis]